MICMQYKLTKMIYIDLRSRVIRLYTGNSKWYKPPDQHANIFYHQNTHTWSRPQTMCTFRSLHAWRPGRKRESQGWVHRKCQGWRECRPSGCYTFPWRRGQIRGRRYRLASHCPSHWGRWCKPGTGKCLKHTHRRLNRVVALERGMAET